MENLRIDGDRLWRSLMTMAEIGATPKGGVRRLALTDEDRRARDLFVAWCEEAGLMVSVDRMGNIFARREGTEDLPPVMAGSHLDSQVTGGRFDGALGVLAALEAVRTLNDHGIRTRAPVEVVNWTNEEGGRFPPPMVASGVFSGAYTLEFGLSCRDAAGRTQGEELERIGYAGSEPVGGRPIGALFELHIEQGPELEERGLDVGVVTGTYGVRGFDVAVLGENAHVGPTPMDRRRNALLGAAMLVLEAQRIGMARQPVGRSAVSWIHVEPNLRGVLPHEAVVAIDFRHPDVPTLDAMIGELRAAMDRIARETKLGVEIRRSWQYGPETFEGGCVAAVREAAARLGYRHQDMMTVAGHDAFYINRIAPTAMIFSPCVGGITHNELEDCTPEMVVPATNVLLHAVLAKAGVAGT
ncbi:MAG TPA: Zn-dependent hydrolase [Geminicoccaceae bacterium]|nr:Zn-dependent hydrolase [Geminicoccaceae bacterium]